MNLLKSAFFGLLFIVAASILLFWAEGRAVNTARALEEGAGLVIDVAAGSVDPANDGKLVHVSGAITPQGAPSDAQFAIAAQGAVSLERTVEMLQWKEVSREVERTGSDGKTVKSTVYDYQKIWSASPIDSSNFKSADAPQNPAMPMRSENYVVPEAKLGAFTVAGSDIAGLATETSVPLDQQGLKQASTVMGGAKGLWLVNGQYLSANDPDTPQIGDVRIGFRRGDLASASAVAKQQAGRLVPYQTSNGRDVFLLDAGTKTAPEMFKQAEDENRLITWLLRFGGLFGMFIGFTMSFAPITGTLGHVPVLGGLVRGGAFLVGLVMTLLLGSLVIGLGWFFYRPILAIVIIVAGVVLATFFGVMGKKKDAPATAR